MNLGDLLPVFAATDAAAASAERNGKFTEFPDEEPTVKQMNDWLEVNLPVITKSHGELMRGALPPALIQLKAEADADLTDYVPVPRREPRPRSRCSSARTTPRSCTLVH